MVMETDGVARDAAYVRLSKLIEPGSLLEATPECLVVAETDGRIVFANHRAESLTGFTRHELVGKSVELLIATELSTHQPGTRLESICRTASGGEVPVEVHVGLIDGPEPLLVVTLRDASELFAGREARFEAEAKYRALVEQIPAVVYLDPVDENSDSIYVSPQVVTLLGVSQDEWLADPYCWRNHVHPEDIDRVWDEYLEAYNNHTTLNHEYRMVHEDGTVRWVMEQAYPINDELGNPWLIQGVIFDITERKVAEEQIAFLAYHDKLTGLPNRALFEEMLESAIARARRHDLGVGRVVPGPGQLQTRERLAGSPLGRPVAGAAGRPSPWVHTRDGPRRPPGRRSVPPAALRPRAWEPALSRGPMRRSSWRSRSPTGCTKRCARRSIWGASSSSPRGSIGISLFPQDALDAETLMKNADTAMYQSKKHEPGGSIIYAMRGEDPLERLSFSTKLRQAVDREHWILHYQPVVDLLNGEVHSLEALIRWQEPNGGIVPPGEFIPLAEELGLIEAIGDWVIDEMAGQHRRWADEGMDLTISFNLSPRQLWSAHLADKVIGKLRAADVDPGKVVVEITESMAMADPDRTQKILTELHAWGLTSRDRRLRHRLLVAGTAQAPAG